jgi:hypothetical protein
MKTDLYNKTKKISQYSDCNKNTGELIYYEKKSNKRYVIFINSQNLQKNWLPMAFVLGKKQAALTALAWKNHIRKLYNFSSLGNFFGFHGTNMPFLVPDLKKSSGRGDLGRGHYLSDEEWHAKTNAFKSFNKMLEGIPLLYKYSYNLDKMRDNGCKIKIFTEENSDFLHFLLANRLGKYKGEEYDVVRSKTADGRIRHILDMFNPNSPDYDPDPDLDGIAKRLQFGVFPMQTAFKTKKALEFLNLEEIYDLENGIIYRKDKDRGFSDFIERFKLQEKNKGGNR